ncbi:protein AKNAD1 [Dasypus novemcinctus]|uniref:protein AKNAD1 n=1 Tax=Dasypus novemcinctus TaxID=9361 RepID=UPI0039C985BF
MEEADFSDDTSSKQQEDLPYDGPLPQIKLCNDYSFTSKNDILNVSDQIILTVGNPQHNETCRNADMTMILDKIPENAVNKKHDKEKQCTEILQIPTNKEDTSRSNISYILLNHLSKEEFLEGQGIDCETLPEVSNVDSFDETLVKNMILHYVKNSWPKEQTPELTDQLNPQSNGENSNKPSCSPITMRKNVSDLKETVVAGDNSLQENVNFLTKIKGPRDRQKSFQGQASRKQKIEKVSSGNGFKYGQGQVHYQLPDFSKIAPKVKIPKNNIIKKPLTLVKQASSSRLRDKSALVQDVLATTLRSNSLEEQHQEQKKETPETSQPMQMEPVLHQELLRGIESETSFFKLTSTSQEDHSSSSSCLFQKLSQGQQMCQKLKEQTDRLRTKVQEFSKRIAQNSPQFQNRSLVLEKLQGHLELLEQEFLATKEKHLILQQQDHKQEFPAVSDFDPERKVEGEIFKLEMLLGDVKEKIDERKYTTALSLPVSSPVALDDLASTSSPPSNEVTSQPAAYPVNHFAENETSKKIRSYINCGFLKTGFPSPVSLGLSFPICKRRSSANLSGVLQLVSSAELPAAPLGSAAGPLLRPTPCVCFVAQEEPAARGGAQERAETTRPRPSCAFCRRVLEWKQKTENKDHRRINYGRFSVVIQEKALHPNLSHSSDAEDSFNSNSGMQRNKREDCGPEIHSSQRIGSQAPPKEFRYRYNTPGQHYLNHSQRGAFVQRWSLDENKNSSPSCSKPKRICSQRTNLRTSQDEHELIPEKKNHKAFRTFSSDFATPSPHFHSRKISGSRSLCDFRSVNKTESEILNSALDTALRTAIVLKETTDRMIKAIAEDLAKAQKWRHHLKYELFHPRKPMN